VEDRDRAALGARLKEMRDYRGLSQEEVAKCLGVPRSAVSLMESGTRRLEALELKKLASLYQCGMDELTGSAAPEVQTEEIKMVARATAKLSAEDQAEVLRFAEFLQSKRKGKQA